MPGTRSRAYRKNDNAHCEQKNWTHVRELLDSEQEAADLRDRRGAGGAELMNDDGGGGAGECQGLAQRGAARQRGGEIGGDGIPGAHHVNLALHGAGGDVLRVRAWEGTHDAPLGQGDEHLAPGASGQLASRP